MTQNNNYKFGASGNVNESNETPPTNYFDKKHIWIWILVGFIIFVLVGTLIAMWVKKGRLSRIKSKTVF